MPPVDGPATSSVADTLRGWGGGEGTRAHLLRPAGTGALRAALTRARPRGSSSPAAGGAIARGMGRSYGDAAQLSGGLVLEMTRMRGLVLDEDQSSVWAQAGTTIGELLAVLVPSGWMLPVVPGTQHVTVGGAIASDVHGKNHPTEGSFGGHVEELELLSADGELRKLRAGHDLDRELLAATVGGMGLTGVIVGARIRLLRVQSALMAVDCDRVDDLEDALTSLADSGGSHRVAWIDMLASRRGRSVVTAAEHMPASEAATCSVTPRAPVTVRAKLTVPERWPAGVLRACTVRTFNELRYRRAPRRERGRPQGLGAHLFPLDALGGWPRLYGPRGLLQYQFAIPDGAERTLRIVIERFRQARVPCFLAVLKRLGPAPGGTISFPLAGWTLALDLPRSAPGAGALLDGLDALVAEAGGRVYLTKDARLKPASLAAMYPRLEEWRTVRDRHDPERLWRSDLAARTCLVSGSAP